MLNYLKTLAKLYMSLVIFAARVCTVGIGGGFGGLAVARVAGVARSLGAKREVVGIIFFGSHDVDDFRVRIIM